MTGLDRYLAKLSPESQARIAARTDEIVQEQMRLAELRADLGLSQADMAKRIGVKQPRVSKMERKGGIPLSAMRTYVEALGGSLEVVASFPNGRRVRIDSAKDLERAEDEAGERRVV